MLVMCQLQPEAKSQSRLSQKKKARPSWACTFGLDGFGPAWTLGKPKLFACAGALVAENVAKLRPTTRYFFGIFPFNFGFLTFFGHFLYWQASVLSNH